VYYPSTKAGIVTDSNMYRMEKFEDLIEFRTVEKFIGKEIMARGFFEGVVQNTSGEYVWVLGPSTLYRIHRKYLVHEDY
jgi:hypothetical protein